jgi:hypothetical protein
LEELDEMDWPRYLRAMEARNIQRVEKLRTELIGGHVQNMGADDADQIAEHDELMRRYG